MRLAVLVIPIAVLAAPCASAGDASSVTIEQITEAAITQNGSSNHASIDQ